VNTYHVTKCPHCGETIVSPWIGMEDEADWITVHGPYALAEALELLKRLPLREVAPRFCGYCGGKMPCGCSHPEPQSAHTSFEDAIYQGKVVPRR